MWLLVFGVGVWRYELVVLLVVLCCFDFSVDCYCRFVLRRLLVFIVICLIALGYDYFVLIMFG